MKFVDYFYVIGLCFYFSGILLILISDYFPDINKENIKNQLSELAGLILNIFTGGLGTILFLKVYGELLKLNDSDNSDNCNDSCCLCKVCCWWIYCLYCIITDKNNCHKKIFILIIIIGGFIGYFGTLYCIFFSDIASKACKITFPIFYGVFSIFFGLLPWNKTLGNNNTTACPIKKKINNKYHLINIDNVEIYN